MDEGGQDIFQGGFRGDKPFSKVNFGNVLSLAMPEFDAKWHTIDSIGKECTVKGENLYLYKNSVPIPPLSFIDDIAAFSKCGLNSIKMNSFLNTKIELKKLQLNQEKCKKLHFGKGNLICPELKVHGSEMKSSDCEKYLGNLISTEMNNKKLIDARVNAGIGYNAQIMSLLNDISLGHHFFKIGKILREAMLINGILFSANAW